MYIFNIMCIKDICLSCLISLAYVSRIVLNDSNMAGILDFFLVVGFHIKNIVLTFLTCILYHIKKVSSQAQCFIRNGY